MFLFREPSEARILGFLSSQRNLPFSYPEVGATREDVPPGYVPDRYRVRLGEGEEAFERGKEALRSWRMFDLGWTRLCFPEAPIETGSTVAVLARHLGFYSLNAARIVYVVEEGGDRCLYGFAYGTLPGHAERGEERFQIEWDRREGSVYYDVFAFSRPNSPLAWAGYPLARNLQGRFARDSRKAMVAATAR